MPPYIKNHYQKFAKYQRIYRRNIFCRYFEVEITDGHFPSVIQSVKTDANFSEFKKKAGRWRGGFGGLFFSDGFKTTARTVPVKWCDRFAVYISDGLTEGFEMTDPYGDVSMFPSESPTEFSSGKPSEKVNIWQLWRPTPPLFLLLLPNPNSPHLQTTSPPSPPQINLPHISTTSYISWSFVVTTSVFWFTDGFYQFL